METNTQFFGIMVRNCEIILIPKGLTAMIQSEPMEYPDEILAGDMLPTDPTQLLNQMKVPFIQISLIWKDFFLQQILHTSLGEIANLHIILGENEGIHDEDCKRLAQLHSQYTPELQVLNISRAVDAAKRGFIPDIPEDIRQRCEKYKWPKFMQPKFIKKGINTNKPFINVWYGTGVT